MIGSVQFESLVELVSYYKRHPLYHKIKLLYPVSEEVVRGMNLVIHVCLQPCCILLVGSALQYCN